MSFEDKGRRGSECWRQAMKGVQLNKRNSLTQRHESKNTYKPASSTSITPLVPQLSGCHITLQNKIAAGSFGQVIKGKRRNKDLAIKKLTISNDTQAVDTRDEILSLIHCQGPNILRFYGVYEDRQRASSGGLKINIVTEYLQDTLFTMPDHYIQRDGSLAIIALSCIKALNYMHHQCELAHLDVKAGNIGYDHKGQVKLLDFGLCGHIGSQVLMRGTVGYHPPEMLLNCEKYGKHKVTGKEDIFSLGCTLYSLVNDHYSPFEPKYLDEMDIEVESDIYNDVTRERILEKCTITQYDVPIAHTDTGSRQFISTCLRKSPGNRPSATDLEAHGWLKDVDLNKPSPLADS